MTLNKMIECLEHFRDEFKAGELPVVGADEFVIEMEDVHIETALIGIQVYMSKNGEVDPPVVHLGRRNKGVYEIVDWHQE